MTTVDVYSVPLCGRAALVLRLEGRATQQGTPLRSGPSCPREGEQLLQTIKSTTKNYQMPLRVRNVIKTVGGEGD